MNLQKFNDALNREMNRRLDEHLSPAPSAELKRMRTYIGTLIDTPMPTVKYTKYREILIRIENLLNEISSELEP